ncbi:MAG: radical SAM protein [Pseudomonadota bacterium]|nr:radical SAM protein [Pseudomonadota bacterium]
MLDVLFVNPDSSSAAYQGLAKEYSAIEPPTWSLLLAESCRARGFSPAILDCDAERLSLAKSVKKIKNWAPKLIVFVIYGQNPNSGTTGMIGAVQLAQAIKQEDIFAPICFCGSHTQALPMEVLSYDCVDLVLLNEGVYALWNLLSSNLSNDLETIKGIGHKVGGEPKINEAEQVVPQSRMDVDMPGYAWDLLPYKERPLDLYRAHFWHADFDHNKRTPFAAIYTSLGCQFACEFCMINIVNRVDNGGGVDASHSRGMRFWSPDWVKREMKKLADLGVVTLRISDEMFFLNRKYYTPILENCIQEEFGFNMWTYSRVDSVRPAVLETFKKAGVNWLALGVEAGNQHVRQEVSKGSFQEINIREVCKTISNADINIISNYIFGFPEDNLETMQETLNLAMELNSEMANMYPCQALPGSPMYNRALREGWDLPSSYEGFAFLSYECEPLRTKYLSSRDVLSFRDRAWNTYFTNPKYLKLVEQRFGIQQRANVENMAKVPLKRKILGN